MLIDKVLARFKIQTKVLLFILPFVVSITAVGITGLYASGLLQERIEISNNVMKALSSFRDLSAAMANFLERATPQRRDTVFKRLKFQEDALAMTLSQLGPEAEGRAQLEKTAKSLTGISTRITELWKLHEEETRIRTQLKKDQALIVGEQLRIKEATAQLQKTMLEEDISAKTILRDADQITAKGAYFTRMGTYFLTRKTAEEKVKVMEATIAEIAQTHELLAAILPAKQQSVATSMGVMVTQLQKILAQKLPADKAAPLLSTEVARFRQFSVYLGIASLQKMKDATKRFSELEEPMARNEAVLLEAGRAINSSYSVQIVLAAFLVMPSSDNQYPVNQELAQFRRDIENLGAKAGHLDSYTDLEKNLVPVMVAMDSQTVDLVAISKKRTADFLTAAKEVNAIWAELTGFAELQKQSARSERENANTISIGATLLGIAIAILAGIGLVLTFRGPIGQITSAMRRIADGLLETTIQGETRRDEIGDMARALGVFKQNALSKIAIEQHSEQQRRDAENERRRNDVEKTEVDDQINFAVSSLAAGLGRLAQGDISEGIETPFSGRLEQLRNDFNDSLARLQDTLSQIRTNAQVIQRNSNRMSGSAEELSRRTEQQAASLEETAAAVDGITVTVQSSAERAQEANHIVADTKRSADASAKVVGDAISAMNRIEDASGKIVQIIDVIDEIAFQTNLLALNAGIEAARAGDAGRGFAVVAMEVRELALRSAGAAKEIKELIHKSSEEVDAGSKLVSQTGAVLSEISSKIVGVSSHVEKIAIASRDQSISLKEINGAVNQMDQMTQKNASMVDETTVASRSLAEEADMLVTLVDRFKLSANGQEDHDSRAA